MHFADCVHGCRRHRNGCNSQQIRCREVERDEVDDPVHAIVSQEIPRILILSRKCPKRPELLLSAPMMTDRPPENIHDCKEGRR